MAPDTNEYDDSYLILDEDFIMNEPGMAVYPTRLPVKNTFQNSNITSKFN